MYPGILITCFTFTLDMYTLSLTLVMHLLQYREYYMQSLSHGINREYLFIANTFFPYIRQNILKSFRNYASVQN